MTRYFTKDHEWVSVDGGIGTVGVTDYARGQLGDVVFVEVPAVGAVLTAGRRGGGRRIGQGGVGRLSPRYRARSARPMPRSKPSRRWSTPRPTTQGWFFKLMLSGRGRAGAADGRGGVQGVLRGVVIVVRCSTCGHRSHGGN